MALNGIKRAIIVVDVVVLEQTTQNTSRNWSEWKLTNLWRCHKI